jgi:hypothetical protein
VSAETGDGFAFVGVDVKYGVKLRGEERVVHGAAELEEFHLAALALRGGISADEFADAAAIEMFDTGEIQQDAAVAFIKILADDAAEFGGAFSEFKRADHVNDDDTAGNAWCGPELHRVRSFGLVLRAGVRLGMGAVMQPLGHYNFRAALAGVVDVEFVHE